MTDAVENWAAWQRARDETLSVDPFELPPLEPDEIRIRTRAVGINPQEWMLQEPVHMQNAGVELWLTYPAILGTDVAGDVVAIGSGVTRFAVGDRVLGHAGGTTIGRLAQGAYQQHSAVFERMACPIPDDMAFIDAAVLPLGLSTAACGLYQPQHLGLARPSSFRKPNGDTVLIWGGSSSVGCNAIQLAKASGYDVVAVASSTQVDLLTRLGASQVVDYTKPDVVGRTLAALKEKTLAGALHATGAMADSFAVVGRCDGRRKVATTLPPADGRSAGVETSFILGMSLMDDGLGAFIYADFLPAALEDRRYHAAPPSRVVGEGLGAFQSAMDAQKKGVSGVKVVVKLD